MTQKKYNEMKVNHNNFLLYYFKLAFQVWQNKTRTKLWWDTQYWNKWWKPMKFGCNFPAFSFFNEHWFGIFMKSIMGTANMTFSKTAHIIQLSIHVPDAMVPMTVWYNSSVIYTLPSPPYSQGFRILNTYFADVKWLAHIITKSLYDTTPPSIMIF